MYCNYTKYYNYLCSSKTDIDDKFFQKFSESDEIGEKKRCISLPIPDYSLVNRNFYEGLARIFEIGFEKGIIKNIITHGSFGDYSALNYSDVDIIILFNQETISNSNLLGKAKKYILHHVIPFMISIDPLQHHGPFFLWPELIMNYNESILPISVYERSWAFEPVDLKFHYTPNRKDDSKFVNTLINLENLYKKAIKTKNIFYIKSYFSNIQILPAFYFLAFGSPCHKSDSFNLLEREFSEYSQSIKIATEVRLTWKNYNYNPKLIKNISKLHDEPLHFPIHYGNFLKLIEKREINVLLTKLRKAHQHLDFLKVELMHKAKR